MNHYPLLQADMDWLELRLTVAVHDINQDFYMSTIGEQLKAARAQLAAARQSASSAVAESADASRAVLQEASKVLKEANDLRAEVAELTNGGPVLEEGATPLPPAPQPVEIHDDSGAVIRPKLGA